MTYTQTKPLSFDEFLAKYPEDGKLYELVDGEIVEMRPIGAHQNVVRFIAKSFDRQVDRLDLDYVVEQSATIKTITKDGWEQGRNPDVSVIDGAVWDAHLSDYAALREPIQLAVEVVSTNWRDDYIDKLDEYQRLGIREYWIVDYRAIASMKYIGVPKVPTISVYLLENSQYKSTQFRGEELIISATFPELKLTVDRLVAASLPRQR